jgi:hypothetical protein
MLNTTLKVLEKWKNIFCSENPFNRCLKYESWSQRITNTTLHKVIPQNQKLVKS